MKRVVLWSLVAIVGLHLACAAGLSAWVAIDTADSAEQASGFLALATEGKVQEAYAAAASGFRAAQDERQFNSVLTRLAPTSYSLESWKHRRLGRGDLTVIRGALITDSVGEVRVTIELEREAGRWRVLSISDPNRQGAGPGAWFWLIPTEEEMKGLVTSVLLEFNRALQEEEFGTFYESMSVPFKISQPLVNFERAYQYLIDAEVDVSGVALVEPVLDEEPRFERKRFGVTWRNVLVVQGHYPTEPLPVEFTLRFLYQHPEWKTFGFFVKWPIESGAASGG